MSPVEIIFVLLGIAILIVSCFVGGQENKENVYEVPEEVLEFQKQEIKKYAEQIMEEKSEAVIVKTDDYLSKVSNEKIMAVNDFTAQILEKIDNNHKEVVFLYDMLNQKEDELKHTVQQFEQEKEQMKEAVDDVIRLTKKITSSKSKEVASKSSATKTSATKPEPKKKTVKEPEVKAVENTSDGQLEFTQTLQSDRQRDEVLKLHKQGKSVLEISKSLGMGQGEVKLIIGLYGA
ncbi:MAG: hypothetical protein IKJ01_10540 [Lachnospiraceae bacterium]|nr:hypothetical protein [Lachnospiraceae bacterium]